MSTAKNDLSTVRDLIRDQSRFEAAQAVAKKYFDSTPEPVDGCDKWIDELLEYWARWTNSGLGLGYSAAHADPDRIQLPKNYTYKSQVLDFAEIAMQVDRVIAVMQKNCSACAWAIVAEYGAHGFIAGLPLQERLSILKCSRSAYYENLKKGRLLVKNGLELIYG